MIHMQRRNVITRTLLTDATANAGVPIRGAGGACRAVSGPGRLRSLFWGRRGLAGYRDGRGGCRAE